MGFGFSRPCLHHALRTFWRDERGDVGSALIIFPVVMSSIFLIVHASFIFHGRQVVSAAAQEALHEAQINEGDPDKGRQAGKEILALSANIDSGKVEVSRNDSEVKVKVTGKVNSPFFGGFSKVKAEVSGPPERFYSESKRQ